MIAERVPYSLGLDKITRDPEVEILRGFSFSARGNEVLSALKKINGRSRGWSSFCRTKNPE
jgi:hypothetical protein